MKNAFTAFTSADILLPRDAEYEKWAVIACDQFTSEPEYWQETEKLTEGAVTALDLILPEIYLGEADVDKRIDKIAANMYGYLDSDVFEEHKNALIYVERIQTDGVLRAGVVGAADLEEYDYSKGSASQIRATEATVTERIPPRIKVREKAPIELPHIMILIDDEKKALIEPLAEHKDDMKKLYDFELMQGGGRLAGWLLTDALRDELLEKLAKFSEKEAFEKRYGLADTAPLTFAMGDGNHSLATAKAYYEKLKAANPDKDMSSHPARYALAEIVNLHSPALDFKAIHRIVGTADIDQMIAKMTDELGLSEEPAEQSFVTVRGGEKKKLYVHKPTSKLTVGSLQNFLDKYLAENGGDIDYIHGTEVVEKLAADGKKIGFVLPDMGKEQLFPTVIADGALPRKTFSMGHARDKRYYVEARKITEEK
mgnify:FL=1